MLKKIKQLKEHIYIYKINSIKRKIAKILCNNQNYTNSDSTEYLLTQIVNDYDNILRIFSFCNGYNKKYKIIAYDTYIPWGYKNKALNFFLKLFFKNGFHFIYKILTNNLYLNIYHYKGNEKKQIDHCYENILKNIKTPKDILDIKIDNILIGDLIYDTYLRFFKKPTIKEINNDVKEVIYKAIIIYFNFNELLNRYQFKLFSTSLTSYLQHGIPTRICLNKNIEVILISSNQHVFQNITKDFPYHSINYTNFHPKNFHDNRFDVKSIFESRFKGQIDLGITYMRNSSYSVEDNTNKLNEILNKNNRNVIIYIHDFYDSPHINRCLMFNDLYDFLKSILDNIDFNSNTHYFIKPHPNSVYNTDEILYNLVSNYKSENLHILSKKISNNDIIKIKPDLIVTARGTITIEMAYHNIPVVCLYDNPYVNFTFAHTCYSRDEFYSIINGYIQPKVEINKSDILSFYYQYFLEKCIIDEENLFSTNFKHQLLGSEKEILKALNNYLDLNHVYKKSTEFVTKFYNLKS
jgi:hypothetical protein